MNHLSTVEEIALKDYKENRTDFINWATKHCADAQHMNIESDAQKQQLIFAPYLNRRTGKKLEKSRVFTVDYEENVITKKIDEEGEGEGKTS